MKNIKRLIIILFTILITIMIIIINILIKLQKNNNTPITDGNVLKTDVQINPNKEKVNIRNNYFTIKHIVEQYYTALCELNKTSEDILIFEYNDGIENLEEEINKNRENTRKQIYEFFDKNYITETGLTKNNIQEKLGNYNELDILIEDMYVRDITVSLKLYFVSGTLNETDLTIKENFELVVALDLNNLTFNIYTSEYAEKYNFSKNFKLNEIEKRTYNKYKNKFINDEQYAKELLKSYTQSIKYNDLDYSYNRLNKEYKTNKFKDIKDYKEYIQENKKLIIASTLNYYKYNVCEGYIQYICIDQNNKYYIFNETSTMNYELILDIYTIDVENFKEKYETASNEEKVLLNVQKITEALNNNDFQYVYDKLDTTFKEKNYSNYNNFKEYIKSNLYSKNTFEYKNIEKHGDVYAVNIIINKYKKINIIIKLSKDTNFYMSFSIEEEEIEI